MLSQYISGIAYRFYVQGKPIKLMIDDLSEYTFIEMGSCWSNGYEIRTIKTETLLKMLEKHGIKKTLEIIAKKMIEEGGSK